ncbi:hypothetical protein EV699_103124 [Plasticicumulans lactativorans]|uniref:Uncharacterized protein n=1 Tax=Plasticicumulans lactativorans TaxID=1133106 RepID=A0A4R2LIU9_9GAMM|nr:hypothetical protein [Plasticicumulans lactativorans]TCO83075.1 hypothetical protein EV699_103124 [Plasticicumulans lactativorans]
MSSKHLAQIESGAESLRADVDRLRARIAALRQEADNGRDQPLNLADATARVDAYLQQQRQRYAGYARVHRFITPQPVRSFELVPDGEVEAYMATFFGDTLRCALLEQIKVICSDGPGLEQRRAHLAKLDRERLDLEREEEALITAAARSGLHIPRRADADPRVFLED